MNTHQKECLDRYEAELRPGGLPPLDRDVDLDMIVLADRVHLMKDFFYFAHWPAEKIYAAAVIYLCVMGYDPQEEIEIAKRMNESEEGVATA